MKVVSAKTNYPSDRLQLCDVYSQRFFKVRCWLLAVWLLSVWGVFWWAVGLTFL